MARRRTTRKTTRRRATKPMLNVLNTAQSLVVANAATKALFGTDVASFALDGWARPATSATNNSWELSAAELVKGMIPGGMGFGQSGQHAWTNDASGVLAAMRRNLQVNGGQAVATMIVAPIAFKAAKRVLGKPLINPANRLLKQAGLATVVKI
jgi:hypothetical protein